MATAVHCVAHARVVQARMATVISVGTVCCVMCCISCGDSKANQAALLPGVVQPDVLPVMLNKDLPFRYPPALYAEKTQGNVTLHLYIDKNGAVVPDSTRVAESAKVPALDSAAIKGARELHFVPAKLRGVPMPVSILFPVYFRHPEASPPAGDTVLGARTDSSKKPASDTVSKKSETNPDQKTEKKQSRSGKEHRRSR